MSAGDNTYRIEYYSKGKKEAEENWRLAAQQLCPADFEILYQEKHTIHGSVRTPVAGQMMDIATEEYIHYGEIGCPTEPAQIVELTHSPWREFNHQTNAIKPVSIRFIAETFTIPINYLGPLDELPAKGAHEVLVKRYGKSMQQENINNQQVLLWSLGGNSWFPNNLVVSFHQESVRRVMILPPSILINVMSELAKKSGATSESLTPGYFIRYD